MSPECSVTYVSERTVQRKRGRSSVGCSPCDPPIDPNNECRDWEALRAPLCASSFSEHAFTSRPAEHYYEEQHHHSLTRGHRQALFRSFIPTHANQTGSDGRFCASDKTSRLSRLHPRMYVTAALRFRN